MPEDVWSAAVRAAASCDLFLVVGTSAQVFPAADLAPLAGRSGARIVEVNIERSGVSAHADLFLEGKAGEILPQIL